MNNPRNAARWLSYLLGIALITSACSTTTTTTTQSGHHHDETDSLDVEYRPLPELVIEVLEDPKSGWNLHASVQNFRLAPEHVSTEPIDGEGHMHLYIDGTKITRLYGEWYHLGVLAPGDHHIRVELSANNHLPLAANGTLIDASVMVTVGGEASTADSTVHMTFSNGEVSGGGDIELEVGNTVTLMVSSDVAEQVHVHGYDLVSDVTPGAPAHITFVVDIPGIWEVELEGSGLVIAHLEVK